MCCCSLLFVSVEKPPPSRTSVRPLIDPQTGKHQSTSALSVCTGPSSLLQTQKLLLLVLRLGLDVEPRATVMFVLLLLNLSAAVVHISSLNSAQPLILLSFPLMFDQSLSFSGQSFHSRGEPLPPPKDCLCLHSGLHTYLCAKMSNSVNYDINVHCSNQTPPRLCVLHSFYSTYGHLLLTGLWFRL